MAEEKIILSPLAWHNKIIIGVVVWQMMDLNDRNLKTHQVVVMSRDIAERGISYVPLLMNPDLSNSVVASWKVTHCQKLASLDFWFGFIP